MECKIEDLYNTFRTKLKNFILAKVKDEDLADDLVQETFIKIFQHCQQGGNCIYPKSFLYKIISNLTMDYYRSADWKKLKTSQRIDLENEEEESEIVSDETDAFQEKAADCIIPIIQTLPSPYKEALELADIEQKSQKEIAETMGISVSGANSRIQRGREKLKDTLLQLCKIEHDCYGNIIDCSPKK